MLVPDVMIVRPMVSETLKTTNLKLLVRSQKDSSCGDQDFIQLLIFQSGTKI